MDVEEALRHPFLAKFRDEKDEPVLSGPVKIPIDDNMKLTIKDYQEALYNDILKKKKEQRKAWREKYLQSIGLSMATKAVARREHEKTSVQ